MANGKITLGKQSGGTLGLVFPDGVNDTEVVLPESGNIASVDTTVTDNSIARYDGTTGKLQDSGVIVDDNGNVGIGITPSNWHTGYTRAVDIGHALGNGTIWSSLNQNHSHIGIGANFYVDSSLTTKYKGSYPASQYEQILGGHTWSTAPSGTAGNPFTWTNAMTLDASGNLLLQSGTGALGYGAGAGGIVTQLTSKSTAVTLNKPSGVIVTHSESIAAGASVTFQVFNSLVMVGDLIFVCMSNESGADVYSTESRWVSNSSFYITLTNKLSYALSGQLSIKFVIIKGSNS